MFVSDKATTLVQRRTPEGFLRLRARIGRAGIQHYRSGEIGGPPGAAPDRVVRVYRPPEDVFDAASLASFEQKPVTLDHPPTMVDARNWSRFAVGYSGPGIARDGDHVAADLTITDAAAVERALAGAELSNGYWADFVFEPGATPDGEAFDAVQRNIRGNHIAIVDTGRCGSTCRIDGDVADRAAQDACDCSAVEVAGTVVRVATLDGAALETTPAVAAHFADFHRALESRDREIAALKAAPPDAALLERLAAERVGTIDVAARLLGATFDARGRSTAEIRRAAVSRLMGAGRVSGRDDLYVAAAFDALAAALPQDNALALHLARGLAHDATSHADALAERNLYLSQAWKGHSAGDA